MSDKLAIFNIVGPEEEAPEEIQTAAAAGWLRVVSVS